MTSEVMSKNQKSWAETPPSNPPLRGVIGEFVENQTWLDKLSNPLQSWLLNFFGQPGEPNRKIKDALNMLCTPYSLIYQLEPGVLRCCSI